MKNSKPDSGVCAQVAGDGSLDAALGAVAAILRALRDAAVRDPEAASQLEAWARHILVLAAPPGSADGFSLRRDWAGLSSHVVAHVRDDHAAMARLICDLQNTVWLVIERLAQAILRDAASDASAATQLERLRERPAAPPRS